MRVRLGIALTLVMWLLPVVPAGAEETAYESGRRALDGGDYDAAREAWAAAPERADPRIAHGLGRLLLLQGGKQDTELGMKLIKRSATSGHLPAQAFLAISHLEAVYTPQDMPASIRWMRAVSNSSKEEKKQYPHEAARSLLTLSSFYDIGIPPLKRDSLRSESLLRESADLGSAEAQWYLGDALSKGTKPFSKDLVEAHAYFVLSWKQGGGVYESGGFNKLRRRHLARDRALAVRRRLSAEQLERSKGLVRAWLKKQQAGKLGWAFNPEKTQSAGERRLAAMEEMHRDISAGLSSMDLEAQMPCLPIVERAKRMCVQGYFAYRWKESGATSKTWTESWVYKSGATVRTYRVRFTSKPGGGMAWRILARQQQ